MVDTPLFPWDGCIKPHQRERKKAGNGGEDEGAGAWSMVVLVSLGSCQTLRH